MNDWVRSWASCSECPRRRMNALDGRPVGLAQLGERGTGVAVIAPRRRDEAPAGGVERAVRRRSVGVRPGRGRARSAVVAFAPRGRWGDHRSRVPRTREGGHCRASALGRKGHERTSGVTVTDPEGGLGAFPDREALRRVRLGRSKARSSLRRASLSRDFRGADERRPRSASRFVDGLGLGVDELLVSTLAVVVGSSCRSVAVDERVDHADVLLHAGLTSASIQMSGSVWQIGQLRTSVSLFLIELTSTFLSATFGPVNSISDLPFVS